MRMNNKLGSIEEFSISETLNTIDCEGLFLCYIRTRANPIPCENLKALKAMKAQVEEVIVEKSEEELLIPLSTAISHMLKALELACNIPFES